MSLLIVPTIYIEPIPIIRVHSDALASVDIIDGVVHFALFARQPSCDQQGLVENIINHRQSMPLAGVVAGLPIIIAKVAEAMALSAADATQRLILGAPGIH